MGSNPTPGIIRLLRYLIAIVGLIFAIYPLFNIDDFNFTFNLKTLLVSMVFLFVSYTFLPTIWYFLANGFGIPIRFSESFYSWFISSMGRYIPGKVWQFIGRVSALNYSKKKVFLAMIYEHLILMLGASIVSLLYPRFLIPQVIALSLLLSIILIWKFIEPYRLRNTILAIVIGVVYWLISGIFAYFVSISVGFDKSWREILFVYSFSFVASYVLPLTPAGLGIREGIIALLMGYNAQSSAFSILTRILISIMDVVYLFLAVGYRRFVRYSPP